MRDALVQLIGDYPHSPQRRDPAFTESPVQAFLSDIVPSEIGKALADNPNQYLIKASAGKGDWTHTPWIAIVDPAVTTSVGEGYYVVYILSHGKERLYLSLNQGCTSLQKAVRFTGARVALRQRAAIIRARIETHTTRLTDIEMDLAISRSVWRGKLYEHGNVVGIEYDAANLPSDDTLIADLREAIKLYDLAKKAGGWDPDDLIIQDARDANLPNPLIQAKIYRQHRAIERQSSHSKAVKKALGTKCMGCLHDLSDVYGPLAKNLIDAHHLRPLSTLNDGQVVTYDPKVDFAVLCPNCHRVIHRMDDTGDIEGLRALLRTVRTGKL